MNGAFVFISVSSMNNCIISVSVNIKRTFIGFSRGIMHLNHWNVYASVVILFCVSWLKGCPGKHSGWTYQLSCGRILYIRSLGQHHPGHEPAHAVPGVLPEEPVLHAAHGRPPPSTAPALHRHHGALTSGSCVHVTLSSFSPSPCWYYGWCRAKCNFTEAITQEACDLLNSKSTGYILNVVTQLIYWMFLL